MIDFKDPETIEVIRTAFVSGCIYAEKRPDLTKEEIRARAEIHLEELEKFFLGRRKTIQ